MDPKPNEFNEEDEPVPETLTPELVQNNQSVKTEESQKNPQIKPETIPTPKSIKTHSKENSILNQNQSLNVSKAYTAALPNNSIYENFDIQQLTYSIMKDYSQLRISKDENFMERMKFDIFKRQIKEDRINKLVEQNKIKIDEEERIKAFNRLIEDANRRIEAQENLEAMKSKLEEDLITPPSKKCKEEEWKDIYEQRFKRYQEELNKKNEEKIKERMEKEKEKEEKEVELCKVKKAPKEVIEKASKRLYEESIKRKLKMESKMLSKVNYENSPSKYKKTVHSSYNFASDSEEENNNERRKVNNNNAIKQKQNVIQNQKIKKKNGVSVTEYNNKRFDICNKANTTNYNSYVQKEKREKAPIYPNKVPHYYDEEEDEDEIQDVPKPIINTDMNVNDFDQKKLEIAAIKRLNNNQVDNNISKYPTSNLISMKESDASKIVDHFFTQNLKHN